MNNTNVWSAYVQRLLDESGLSEAKFSAKVGIPQSTINRWRNGLVVPNKIADVAHFARELGRNPIEAFVASGHLADHEAGRSLSAADRRFLASVSG